MQFYMRTLLRLDVLCKLAGLEREGLIEKTFAALPPEQQTLPPGWSTAELPRPVASPRKRKKA